MAKKKEKAEVVEEFFLNKWEHDYFFAPKELEQTLVQRLSSGRLHHSWLIEGMEGIGKATLALRLARFLLASKSERTQGLGIAKDSQTWHLTKAHSHPDFLYVSPAEDSKTQSITIDKVRELNQFFTKSPALSVWRVAIIDAVDNMNSNAANATLKLLEEPPAHAIIFLVSHRAGSVLATIRSRCQRLKLLPLDEANMRQGIKTFLPDLTPEETGLAMEIGGGSLGKALNFANQEGIALCKSLQAILGDLSHFNHGKVQAFCARLADNKEHYNLFCNLILDWSHSIATKTSRSNQGIALWGEVNEIIKTTQRLNMDKKLAAQNIFLAVEKLAA